MSPTLERRASDMRARKPVARVVAMPARPEPPVLREAASIPSCFVCGKHCLCEHREVGLREWWRKSARLMRTEDETRG